MNAGSSYVDSPVNGFHGFVGLILVIGAVVTALGLLGFFALRLALDDRFKNPPGPRA